MDRTLKEWSQSRYLADAALQPRYVSRMFAIIAPRYDRFTRAFSFGMDQRWKQLLVDEWARRLPPGPVADVACGTGDLAGELARQQPQRAITGVDLVPHMVALAQRRHAATPTLHFTPGDMMDLPFADGSLAGLSAGYGMRNTVDWRSALAESARTLAPGGVLAILDFFQPRWAPWRRFYLGYLRAMGLFYGRQWHGDGEVYGYISRSIARFTTIADFEDHARSCALKPEWRRTFFGGGMGLLMLRKNDD